MKSFVKIYNSTDRYVLDVLKKITKVQNYMFSFHENLLKIFRLFPGIQVPMAVLCNVVLEIILSLAVLNDKN